MQWDTTGGEGWIAGIADIAMIAEIGKPMLTAEARRRGEQPRTEDRNGKTLPFGGRSGNTVIGKPEMLQPQGTLRKRRKGVRSSLVNPLIPHARIPKSGRNSHRTATCLA
jgi:hypothetical protein